MKNKSSITILISFLLFIIDTGSLFAQKITFPTIISKAAYTSDFIPNGWAADHHAQGDLNGDEIDDAVLILNSIYEDTLFKQGVQSKRILLVLIGQSDQSYSLASQNINAVYSYGYDANFRDALATINIENGELIISHYGGSKERWGRTTIFAFDKLKSNWLLTKDELTTFDSTNEAANTIIKSNTKLDFGEISISTFDISQ